VCVFVDMCMYVCDFVCFVGLCVCGFVHFVGLWGIPNRNSGVHKTFFFQSWGPNPGPCAC